VSEGSQRFESPKHVVGVDTLQDNQTHPDTLYTYSGTTKMRTSLDSVPAPKGAQNRGVLGTATHTNTQALRRDQVAPAPSSTLGGSTMKSRMT